MDETANPNDEIETTGKVKSVAAKILGEFFDALDKEVGLEAVSPQLRKLVLDEAVFAEPAIRAALLPDAT